MGTNTLIFVGVDPGLKGGIAFLDPGSMRLKIHDMPVGKSSSGKNVVDLRILAQILNPGDYDRAIAVIERVHAMPKDSKAGAFSFGEGYGGLRMAVIGHGYEDRYVTPAAWKKHFRLSSDKGVSRSYACTRFPNYAGEFARALDDGRAEAALIALYGAEVLASNKLNPTP